MDLPDHIKVYEHMVIHFQAIIFVLFFFLFLYLNNFFPSYFDGVILAQVIGGNRFAFSFVVWIGVAISGYLSVVVVTSFKYESVILSMVLYGFGFVYLIVINKLLEMERVAETGSVVGSKRKSSRNIGGISKKDKTKKNMAKLSDSIDDGSEHVVDFISKEKKENPVEVCDKKKAPDGTEWFFYSCCPYVSFIVAKPVIYFIVKLVFYFKIKPKKRFRGVAQDFNDTSVLLEIKQLNMERDDEECWYKIGSKAVRFGVEEFSAITGFNCGGQYDLKPLSKKKMLKFKARMFPNFGITDKVTRRDVRDVFLDQEFLMDDDDVVKMGVVYLLSCYLFGFTHDKNVDNFLFGLVNGDDYLDVLIGFAFGKMLWERTFYYLTIAIKDGNSTFDELETKGKKFKKYKLPGFVVPFHVWLYEIIPSLSSEYCVRKGSEFRRILNWQSFGVPGFVTLLEKIFNNPEVIVEDFRLTDAERRNRLLKNFKFQPVYLPKSVDDEKDFEEKFENICKNSQVCICNEMTIFRDEFSRDLAKLSGMIEKMNSKNHEKMDTADLFGASDREAYYRDLSDDVGGLELSVHSVKSAVHEDNVDYGQYYLSPDVMKVVDNTIKDVFCSKDQPSCKKNNNMEMVVFDDSYQMPKNPKRIRKESAIVLSPFITDFGSSDSGKDSLMNILIGDKLIVDGLNPFKNEIGDNNTNEQCLKFIQWLEHNINMKSTKKKYSDVDNKIDPPKDFSFIQIDEKIWFYTLQTCGNIKDRMLNVYNSLSGLRNQNKVLPHGMAYSVMLPYFLEFLNFYASSYCGVFVIKFADLFINEKINEIPRNMADRIATYRDDLARKQIGGYQTEDDVQVRKEKSKKLKEKKNAKGKGKEITGKTGYGVFLRLP
ncbi:hypothetical protein G4B88_009565 [Cannabis sativa]|uniref:DUF1985 domain-containing protein n=1 Tax=Cannabis sativa TaxID=3483 RepID=A0A7J6DLK8_CANSA|nr:hypothetical protein G4B88_009565 [Cannabis sativa]